MTLVSAIVVTQRGGPLLDACLRALRAALSPLDAELLVVDNSDDGLARRRARGSCRRAATSASPAGSSPASRRRRASGSCSSTTTPSSSRAPRSRCWAWSGGPAEVGIACGQVRFHARRDTINTAGLVVDRLGVAFDRLAGAPAVEGGPVEEVFGASACVALYRRAMLDAIGGFDASFFAFGEDADVAWRARTAGWSCLYVPSSVAYHHGSATAGEASARKYFLVGRNRMRLLAKNATGGQLARWGWAMALYDLAYVAFVALTDRTLAPLRGRLAGLREWRAYRRAGAATRGPAPLAAPTGPLGAWRQRKAYRA